MADTIPNIIVPPNTPVDLYSESGVAVGTKISVAMNGGARAKLYSGATLTSEPNDETGYRFIFGEEEFINDVGDSGAWIYSKTGCTVNVKVVV